jgi:hypothetical protein
MHFGTSASRFPLPLWVAGPRCPCRRQLNCVRSRAAGPGCRSLGLGRTYVRLLGFPWVRNGGLSRCLGVVERFAGLWRVVKNAHVALPRFGVVEANRTWERAACALQLHLTVW